MPIVSGPTKERLIRVGIFFLMCAGMGAYFLYDGYVGYPSQNFREHVDQLPPDMQEKAKSAPVYAEVTSEAAPAVESALNKVGLKDQRAALESALGGPPSFETPEAWWWFGPVHRYKVEFRNGRPTGKVEFQSSAKKENDLFLQKLIGAVLCGVALVAGLFWIRIAMTRAVVDEKGLSLRGRAPIAFESITGIDDANFRKKGWLDLLHSRDGREQRTRLDEYHLSHFAEIVAAICEKKGFHDPVADEKAEKAARAAGAA
jgi:hypothetical protein